MQDKLNRASLRKMLLEKRDNTSFDLMEISSKQIQKRLKKINTFRDAMKIAAYYPIGSEVMTQNIIQEMLSKNKEVFLPKVIGADIEFRKITEFADLEIGSFDILEPKPECVLGKNFDVMLVPTVGISEKGVRLGYGHGYYDRFLAKNKITTISLVLEKQIVKNIPKSEHDVLIDWIVTEDRVLEVSEIR